MSTCKANNFQIGQSITATNNFVLYQPASPDGTVRLGNGNSGSVTDLITVGSTGNLTFTGTTETYTNSVTITAASTKTLTLNGGAGSNGLVIDASNNVGLGVTPNGVKLNVTNGGLAVQGTAAYPTTGAGWEIISNTSSGVNAIQSYNRNTSSWMTAAYYGSDHKWFTNASQTMTLDASGNLLVGTTNTATAKVTVSSSVGSQWGIDLGTNSTISVASGANAIIAQQGTGSQGSGLIIITDISTTGSTAAYLVGGGTPIFLGGSGSTPFVSPTTTPAAGKACIAFDGTSAIRIYNNYGSTITFGLGMIKTRNSL